MSASTLTPPYPSDQHNDASSIPVRIVAGSGGTAPAISRAPYKTAAAITPGTAFTPGQAIYGAVTTAGNITLTLSSGATVTLPLEVGLVDLPFYATGLTLGSGTAGTFYVVT